MTALDLLRRVRQHQADGMTLDSAIAAVVNTVAAESPTDLRQAWEALAPIALRRLELKYLRAGDHGGGAHQQPVTHLRGGASAVIATGPAVPIGNRGVRKPVLDWTRDDLAEAIAYGRTLLRALGIQVRTLERVHAKLKPKQRVRDVWACLSEAEQVEVSRIGGLKRLAG